MSTITPCRAMLRLRARLVALAALLTLASPGQAQIQAVPWSYFMPTDQFNPPAGGEVVRITSPQPGARDAAVMGMLYKPVGTPKGAVVIVNATNGWTNAREGQYGRSFASAGYAVLAIDTYSPRSVRDAASDMAQLSPYAQLRDALAARAYLVAQGFSAERLAVMGTGRGGSVALLAADRTFLPEAGERFALAMAISPGCFLQPRAPKPAAQVFMALAQNDDIAGALPCRQLAGDFIAAGGVATYKTYAETSNSFDGNPVATRMMRDPFTETYKACQVAVEPDGQAVFGGQHFGAGDFTGLVTAMRRSCIGRGATVWTNPTRKANLTLDLIELLDSHFRR